MPIPELEDGYLPTGEHDCTLEEVERVFGESNHRRRSLFLQLEMVVQKLRDRGVSEIWVDGSFTTGKLSPRDVDMAYQPSTTSDPRTWTDELNPANRGLLKKNRRIDMLPSRYVLDTFKTDRSGVEKGILHLNEEA